MADLTWGTIKEWKSAHLDSVVEGLLNQRNKAMGVHEQIRDIDVTTGWEGNGASASQNALARLKDICAHHLGLIGELMTATSSAQSGLSEVEHAVAEAQSFADSNGFSIDHEGTVHDFSPPPPLFVAPYSVLRLGREQKLKECRDLVSKACDKAGEVDQAYVKALGGISQGKDSDPETFDELTPLPDLPREGASTEEVAQWWHSLSDGDRERLINGAIDKITKGRDPDGKYAALGNLDGISGNARDRINQARLDVDLAESEKEMPRIREEIEKAKAGLSEQAKEGRSDEDFIYDDEDRAAYQKNKELKGIKDALNDGVNKPETDKAHLYLYDPPSDQVGHDMTHAALYVGDIDNDANVATVVPGTTANVADSRGTVGTMLDLKHGADARSPDGGKTSVMTWIGYDAPPTLGNAPFIERAERGGDALAQHLEGIEDSRNASGNPVHQSLLGHSYGSTTASYGAEKVRPGVVDDFAVYGSPGVAAKAPDLNVPEGHSYAMGFREGAPGVGYDPMNYVNDRIFRTQEEGEGGLTVPGHGAPLGYDPMGANSGFKTLDPGTPKVPEGESHINPHSAYLVNESQAQSELIKVITGAAG